MSDFKDANRDPLTNEPGAHPIGTGVGAAGGAVAGAATGAIGGPIGAAVGGVAGAVVGGLAGKAAAEAVNPTAEDAYWRETYQREPYYVTGRAYEEYRPAYEMGWIAASRYPGDFETVEPELSRDWGRARAQSSLEWAQAQPAARAAWDRVRRNPTVTASGTAAGATLMDNEDVVDVLDDLLECSRDGEYGFRTSADRADSPELKSLLERRAQECATAATELESAIRSHGGEPSSGGTMAGALHRGWVSVKAALSTYDDKAVLEECERGEDVAMARYNKALENALPPAVRTLVERQAQGVKRNHNEVRALRNRFQAAS